MRYGRPKDDFTWVAIVAIVSLLIIIGYKIAKYGLLQVAESVAPMAVMLIILLILSSIAIKYQGVTGDAR